MIRRLWVSRFVRARRTTAIVVALAGLGVGCTLITARTNGQCLTDNDCRSRGGAFAQTRCSAIGTCEVVTLPEAGVDAGVACTTNTECSSLLNARARCVTTGGGGAGTCQKILNDQCTASDGDATDDGAIFVGVMTPRTGPNELYGLNQYQIAATAAAEWKSQIAGQVGTHNFVTIGCDELVDPVGVANFLANQVHVTAILGPMYDNDFEQVVPVANATGVFLLGGRADDLKIPTLPGIGQNVWSCMPNRSTQVALFPPLMSAIETSIKVSHPADIKVFFAAAADTGTTNFANAVEQVLFFNGKAATANGGNYIRQTVPFNFSTPPSYTDAVGAMVGAAPDLVILAQEFDAANFLRAMNDSWPSSSPPLPRVLMLVADPQVQSDLRDPMHNRFAGKVDFLQWHRTPQELVNATTFAASYRATAQQDPAFESERLYDCFYENAYSIQSALDQGAAVEGVVPSSFGDGITALNGPGTIHNVGGTDIPPMLNLLSAKGAADLEGASSALQMDPAKGSPTQNVDLNCIQNDGGVTASGLQFNGVDGGVTGSYSCL